MVKYQCLQSIKDFQAYKKAKQKYRNKKKIKMDPKLPELKLAFKDIKTIIIITFFMCKMYRDVGCENTQIKP